MAESRRRLEKRKAEFRRLRREKSDGALGEDLSKNITNIKNVSLELIDEDPRFQNTRLFAEPHRQQGVVANVQTTEALMESMSNEGLKIPILIIPNEEGRFFVRAGFRRLKCAKKLGWKTIPAIVLPPNTPEKDEYWANILENVTRKHLSTYELASSALMMKNKFQITPREYASKTGFHPSYVTQMIFALENLPEQLVENWKNGASLSFNEWYKLSLLDRDHALKIYNRWLGLQVKRPEEYDRSDRDQNGKQLAPAWMLDRFKRLYIGIEASDLDPRTRDLVLKVIEYCEGSISKIPGVYEPRKQSHYEDKADLRRAISSSEISEDEFNKIDDLNSQR